MSRYWIQLSLSWAVSLILVWLVFIRQPQAKASNEPPYYPSLLRCLAQLIVFISIFATLILAFHYSIFVGEDKAMVLRLSKITAYIVFIALVLRSVRTPIKKLFAFRSIPTYFVALLPLLAFGFVILKIEFATLTNAALNHLGLTPSISESYSHGLLNTIGLIFIAPICEEIYFRGLLLPGFMRKYGRWPSILITALIFSLVHGLSSKTIPIFGSGILYAWLALQTGSILPSLFLHIFNNGALEYLPYLPQSSTPSLTYFSHWIDLIALLLTATTLWFLKYKNRLETLGPPPPARL